MISRPPIKKIHQYQPTGDIRQQPNAHVVGLDVDEQIEYSAIKYSGKMPWGYPIIGHRISSKLQSAWPGRIFFWSVPAEERSDCVRLADSVSRQWATRSNSDEEKPLELDVSVRQETPTDIDLASRINKLLALSDDWDGDGAVAPSSIAGQVARIAIRSTPSDVRIVRIDADVIGGLTIWLKIPGSQLENRQSWIAIRNVGTVLLALDQHQDGGYHSVEAISSFKDGFSKARAFLKGEHP